MAGDTMATVSGEPLYAPPHVKTVRSDSLTTNIIDIRQDSGEFNLLEDIKNGLRPADGKQKSLPTLLLYDEPGLKLFEKITYLEEYYLTNAEIDVLKKYASHIAERIQPNSIVLELGSGNLRKIRILLDALDNAGKAVEYYALDVSIKELERTLSEVPYGTFRYVKCLGLHGTYDDGLEWLKSKGVAERPKTVITMGSSIGNFSREDGASFLKEFGDALQPGDSILVGIDACKDPEKVFHAYNDKEDVTHEFILNGLVHANALLGHAAFDIKQWKVIGEYDTINGKHHAFVAPKKDVTIDGVIIRVNEKIHFENSYKYSTLDSLRLWEAAGLKEGAKWSNTEGNYGLHMAYKSDFEFPSRPEKYAASPVPSLTEWDNLWTAWDAVTQQMIPKEELLSKPIKLRNACIFYIGHIPTFLAIHLKKATGEGAEGLKEYQQIFERGIDPDVENPELCHDHSEIPDEYPPTGEVLAFQTRVRTYLRGLYASGAVEKDYAVRKAIWIGFEHEAMHLETLLYMLVQSEKTNPLPGAVPADFEAMAREAEVKSVPNQWFDIPARKITLGLVDDDKDHVSKRYFGWDNEKPQRHTDVHAFTVRARPITNGEYAKYLESKPAGSATLPASWSEMKKTSNGINGHANGHADSHVTNRTNGTNFLQGKAVRTVFGSVPLKWALDWPVMASYDELAGFARWTGGRIPTMEEVKSIYEYVDELKSKEIENALGKTIPAVNSHLINDGVEETPPHNGSSNGASSTATGPSPNELFVNLEGANVGFKHFHPTPVTQNGDKLAGQGELGGVWEWTSSVLEKHDGFEAMELYPGYTADFFDKKHNIVLGGSWATHPRLAGRKSFVNWYQRNYPYVWAGARLAK